MLIFLEQENIGLDHTLIFCSLNIFFAHGLFLLKIPKKYFFLIDLKFVLAQKSTSTFFQTNNYFGLKIFGDPTLFILSD